MIRLAHFSDIHVEARSCWKLRDWFGKRITSWLNLRLLGRGHRFGEAERVLQALRVELQVRQFDHVIFSGDASALGFDEEFAKAAALLGIGSDGLPGLAVPGNHDHCTYPAAASGDFERRFAPWLVGERVDGEMYPFAQRAGPVWLVAVNSAVPHWCPIDASGRVGADQLQRLETLLARLDRGPRILVTHYPVYVADGGPETRYHALRDLEAVISVARAGGVSLWLHGHRHGAYWHDANDVVPFPVICSGSATERRRWSYGDYALDGDRLRGVVRQYDEKTDRFVDVRDFEAAVSGAI
jgi:3',5'-cyclic AMP phosphodiesterase CpdA